MSNGLLSVAGYGEYRVTVTSISYGVQVVAGAPDEARNHRAFYMSKRTGGRFSLGLVFTSQADYGNFGRWIQGYGMKVSNPNAIGAMRVTVPVRAFDRVAVPVAGVTFGESVGQITYPMVLQFDGARETGDFKSPAVSKFQQADTGPEESKFFYPAGIQLTGMGAADDILYGVPQGTTAITNLIKNLFGGGGGNARPADNTAGAQR